MTRNGPIPSSKWWAGIFNSHESLHTSPRRTLIGRSECCCHYTPECGTRAAGYALDAMSEGATPEQVLGLLQKVVTRGFDSEEFRTSCESRCGQTCRP